MRLLFKLSFERSVTDTAAMSLRKKYADENSKVVSRMRDRLKYNISCGCWQRWRIQEREEAESDDDGGEKESSS